MGFGLPAAIGAKVAAPQKTVIDVDGDASFSMTAMELATASQYNIGVKVLILNNEFQGMVLQWQGPSHSSDSVLRLSLNRTIRSILQRPLLPHTNGKS
jgi:thiamine pyrophosphate-dependent acetolactate synthase large subunit-like protein